MITIELNDTFLGEAYSLEVALKQTIEHEKKMIKVINEIDTGHVHLHRDILKNCKSILKQLKSKKS